VAQIILFDGFELDLEQQALKGPEGPIGLRPQTYAVLCHLIEKAPGVVSQDDLLDEVWGHQATSVSSVAQTIKELRNALGDSSSKPRFIATRRRMGYQFIAEIERRDTDASRQDPASNQTHAMPESADGAATERWFNHPWALIGVVTLFILLAAVWRLQPSAPVPAERLPTLAIGNMVNSSADPELNWLAPALETYLGHALVELGGFRVLAIDNGNNNGDDELSDVDYVIEGQYLSAGVDGSRLLARLQRPGSSEVISSLESEASGWDVSRMTIDMAGAIRDQLGFQPPAQSDASALTARLPRQPESQRAYFKARQALDQLSVSEAIDELDQALIEQPDSPQLQMLKAQALSSLGDVKSARELSEQALASTGLWPRRDRLDLEATAAMLSFDFDRAADRLQALNQFFPEAASSRQLVFALMQSGRLNAGREALDSLRSNRPDDPRLALLGAELARLERNYDERLTQAQQAAELAQLADSPGLLIEARLVEADALIRTGQLDQARTLYEQLLDGERLLSNVETARIRLGQAKIEFQQGRFDNALAMADQAEALFTAIPHPEGLADTYSLRASVHDRAGRLEQAVAALDQAMEYLDTLGDPRRLAQVGVLYGITLMRAGQFDAAVSRLEQAASYFRAVRDRQGEGAALINLGNVTANSGRLSDAEPVFQRALEAFEDAGDLRGQAIVLSNLAAIAGQRRDVSRSVELAERALGMFELIGAQTDIARVSYNLALTHQRQGQLLQAEARIRQASEAFAEQGAVMMQARSLTALANLLVDMGRDQDLIETLESIDALAIDDAGELAIAELARGRHALSTSELPEARAFFETAMTMAESANSSPAQLRARLNLARADLADGQSVRAEQAAILLRSEFAETRDQSKEVDALLILAEARILQNRRGDAARDLSSAEAILADAPDARQALELAILRSQISSPELALQRLDWAIETAGRQGFEPLMEKARSLRDQRVP